MSDVSALQASGRYLLSLEETDRAKITCSVGASTTATGNRTKMCSGELKEGPSWVGE